MADSPHRRDPRKPRASRSAPGPHAAGRTTDRAPDADPRQDEGPKPRCARVLLVDPSTDLGPSIQAAATASRPVELVQVGSLAQARRMLEHYRGRGGVDLAVIAAELPDGSGLDLADRLGKSRKMTHTIVVTRSPSLDRAMRAFRAGASDYVIRPAELGELSRRVRRALTRQGRDKLQHQRIRRLRRLCRKLNQARLEVSQQVDALCEDLVRAYRELADQVHSASPPPPPDAPDTAGPDDPPEPAGLLPKLPDAAVEGEGEGEDAPASADDYAELIRDQLDLEGLIRTTLEYLVDRAGPANAAIFLPASMEEYALGGYVNYDVAGEAASMVLDHLADVFAPRVAASAQGDDQARAQGAGQAEGPVVHVRGPAAFRAFLGEEAVFLKGRELLAFTAAAEDGEPLAVVALFRDAADPFAPAVVEACRDAAPRLGQALARVIKIHHRHLPFDACDEGDPDAPGDLPF